MRDESSDARRPWPPVLRYLLGPAGIALSLALALAACDEPRRGVNRPSVLLITVDTLRADRLGCYGYHLATSPNIDRLAQRGVRFDDCTVQWPKTWPSMASMLTGAHPKTIGIAHRRRVMHPALLLISEVLQQAGYRTGAVVANFNIGRTFGFDQGFDVFVESWREEWAKQGGNAPFRNEPGKVKHYTNARLVTDQGLRWLAEADPGTPFFLWLHYMDPHGPYLPPAAYAQYFQGAHAPEPTPEENLPAYQIQRDPRTKQPIADLAFYRAQYDREVRFLDDELGRLFEELEHRDFDRRNTLIVFTADHGESFSEHDYYLEHGRLSYQPSARVPLIIAQDGRLPAGRVVERPVGLIDAPGTILDLAGIDIPYTFEGRSLTALIREDSDASDPEYVFMEAGHQKKTQISVRKQQWKLIHVRSRDDRERMTGDSYELYDVRDDPGELRNLAGERPDLVAALSRVLTSWYTSGPRWEGGEEVDLRSLSPKEQEMLQALGYLP